MNHTTVSTGSQVVDVATWVLRFPYHHEAADGPDQNVDLVGVEVSTAGGTTGMGFTYSLCGGGHAIESLLSECLLPAALGCDLGDRWRLWERLAWSTRRLGLGLTRHALAALDIALWDAAARAAGLPLHALLGTRRNTIALFSSGRYSPALSPDRLAANALEEVGRGATSIKLRIGGRPPVEDLARVKAVRESIGAVDLFVDAAELLTFDEALWLAPRLEELGVSCLEEPFRAENIDQYRALNRQTRLAIAGGEHLLSREQFLAYLRAEAVTIINPDVAIVGGITEFMRICELADVFGVQTAPHLVTDLHAALAPAIPGLRHVEDFPFTGHLWTAKAAGTQPDRTAGQAVASALVGHGLVLSPARRLHHQLGLEDG